MEPLAVAVHAVSSIGRFQAGQSAAVFGCGSVGLLCMAVARAAGARCIFAVDNNSARLDFAKNYVGATTFKAPLFSPGEPKMDYSERSSVLFKNVFGMERENEGIDLAVDATGAETCIQMACFITKAGGTLVLVSWLFEFFR